MIYCLKKSFIIHSSYKIFVNINYKIPNDINL